jgi:hypothetical protein
MEQRPLETEIDGMRNRVMYIARCLPEHKLILMEHKFMLMEHKLMLITPLL